MTSSSRNRPGLAALAAFAALFALGGCADYLNNWDTSSARTGNASMANTAIQSIETWPPAAYRSTVGSGG